MKTQSSRIKEANTPAGQMTVIALVFAFVFSPIGLILYFYAKKQEKDSPMLKLALIISIIGTILWALGLVMWGLSFFWSSWMFWTFWHI